MLEEFKKIATLAHYGTSFSPEKRGEQTINEYTELLAADLETIKQASDEVKAKYIARFKKYLGHYLSAKSRCVSPMIAGSSNFPVRQQQKYHNWEDNAYNGFKDWRNKAMNAILKQIEKNKPENQKIDEAWIGIKKEIERKAKTIIEIDTGINTYSSRTLFVNSITGLIKRMTKNGQHEHVKRSMELIKELNKIGPKPIITEKNAIFKQDLVEIASEIKADKQNETLKESDILNFTGGVVVLNYGLNRLQIKHDSKPAYEIIQTLKKNGFKWSPREMAWQRFLNNESKYIATNLTGVNFSNL